MNSTDRTLATTPIEPRERPARRTFFQALLLWLLDADVTNLIRALRVVLLILAGYAPFAALNDALVPLTFGIPLIDDLEIPLGVLAAIKIFYDIRKYQSPSYRPRRR